MTKTADLTLTQASAPYDWGAVLRLLHAEFAYMQGRIDPPSSLALVTPDSIAAHAEQNEVWVIEAGRNRPVACIFLTPQPPTLFVGKIAVAHRHRGQGLARRLINKAVARAKALGLEHLTLQSRVELTENHAAFNALGFTIVGDYTHHGYSSPTSITMQRPLGR